MAQITQIKRTIGDFRRFKNMQFPLDTDGLADSQTNDALLSVLGNIGGDRYILSGLDAANNNAGYVFLATQAFPSGELLYVEPRSAQTGFLCLKIENIDINASGYPYPQAYTKRTLEWGVPSGGVESFEFSTFEQLETNLSLQKRVDELAEKVRLFSPEAVGSIKMWASATMPSTDWQICDGSSLDKTLHAALFAVLGTQFGGAGNSFNLPDFRGKSPFGFMANDPDFGKMDNDVRGEKAHKLTEDEMPPHTHTFNDKVVITSRDNPDATGGRVAEANGTVRSTLNSPNKTGGGLPHNNLPPFMAINFIIRVK